MSQWGIRSDRIPTIYPELSDAPQLETPMNIEQLSARNATISTYQKVEALMVQAASDGQITCAEETSIKAAMLQSKPITPELCRLFRHLQERVWDGELLLDARD
jgi:hypothetical protein